MKPTDLKKACVDLMSRTTAVYLTTIEGDYPNTRALLNLRNAGQYPHQVPLFEGHHEDLLIYFSTNTSSDKVRQIKVNPRVSVYYCDSEWGHFHGLMLQGDIEIVNNAELRHALWNEGWERYYPGGPDDPDNTVLRLYPRLAKVWYKAAKFEFRI